MTTLIENPQHLGDVVRQARKALSLTQPQLALAAMALEKFFNGFQPFFL